MRTTIDLRDEQKAELIKIAASRGLVDFSAVVQDAVDAYLRSVKVRSELVRAAQAVRGALDDIDTNELEQRVLALRGSWR